MTQQKIDLSKQRAIILAAKKNSAIYVPYEAARRAVNEFYGIEGSSWNTYFAIALKAAQRESREGAIAKKEQEKNKISALVEDSVRVAIEARQDHLLPEEDQYLTPEQIERYQNNRNSRRR